MRFARATCAVAALAGSALGMAACHAPPPSYVSIVTMWPGAIPADVEESVTKIVEDAVSGCPDVAGVDSISIDGSSTVLARLKPRASAEVAAEDVHKRVAASLAHLPVGALAPSIERVDAGSVPVLSFTMNGTLPRAAASAVLIHFVRPRLDRIPGVARITVDGAAWREIDVRVDAEKARAHNVTAAAVASLLRSSHVHNARDIGAVALSRVDDVKVADVASIEEGSRIDSPGPLQIAVWKQPGASTAQVQKDALEEIDQVPIPGTTTFKAELGDRGTMSIIWSGADNTALEPLAREAARRIARPGFVDVDAAPSSLPHRRIAVDNDRAAALGVTPADAAMSIRYAMAGEAVTKLEGLKDVDVRVSQPVDEHAPLLQQVFVTSATGALVPLSAIASETLDISPAALERRDRVRALRLCARIKGSVDDAVVAARAAIADLPLPPGAHVVVEGGPLLPVSPCAVATALSISRNSP